MITGSRCKRILGILPVILASSLALAACSSSASTSPSSSSKSSVPHATLVSLLTPDSYGLSQSQGMQLAVKELKSEGIVDFNLTQINAGSSPTSALSGLSEAISDNPAVIVGPLYGTMLLAMKPKIEAAGIPVLVSSGTVAVTSPPNKWIFRYYVDGEPLALVQAAAKRLGITKAAILYGSGQYGSSGLDVITKALDGIGVKIVTTQSVSPGATSLAGQVHAIMSSGANGLFVHISTSGRQVRALDALRAAGFSGRILWGSGITANAVDSLVSASQLAGIYTEAPAIVSSSTSPAMAAFISSYEQMFHTTPSVFAGLEYDAVMMAGQAIRKVGTGHEALWRELSSMSYKGVVTQYRAGTDGTMVHNEVLAQFGSSKNIKVVGQFAVPYTPRKV